MSTDQGNTVTVKRLVEEMNAHFSGTEPQGEKGSNTHEEYVRVPKNQLGKVLEELAAIHSRLLDLQATS